MLLSHVQFLPKTPSFGGAFSHILNTKVIYSENIAPPMTEIVIVLHTCNSHLTQQQTNKKGCGQVCKNI